VLAVDADGSDERPLVGAPAYPRAAYPSWSPDGAKVAFNAGFEDIAVIDLRSKKVRTVVDGWSGIGRPAWSPNGKQIVISDTAPSMPGSAPLGRDFSDEFYVVNADGTGLRRLTHNRVDDWNPAWWSKRKIVFQSERGGGDHLYVMDLVSRRIRRLSGFPTGTVRVEPKVRCSGRASQ
jgi:TolB protein